MDGRGIIFEQPAPNGYVVPELEGFAYWVSDGDCPIQVKRHIYQRFDLHTTLGLVLIYAYQGLER